MNSRILRLRTFLGLLATLPAIAIAEIRVWTDASGKHQIEAEFVALDGDNVSLKKSDGKILTLPLARLSPKDREFAKSLAAPAAAAPQDYQVSAETDLVYVLKGNGHYKLHLTIDLTEGAAADAFAIGPWSLQPIAAGGETFKVQEREEGADFVPIDRTGQMYGNDHPENGARLQLLIEEFSKEAKSLESVEGSVKVWAGGEVRSILIDDMLERPEGPIDDPALKEAGVEFTLTRRGAGEWRKISVIEKRQGVSKLAGVEVVGADGKSFTDEAQRSELERAVELEIDSESATGAVNHKLEDLGDKKLRVFFRVGARELELPFEVEKVAIKGR